MSEEIKCELCSKHVVLYKAPNGELEDDGTEVTLTLCLDCMKFCDYCDLYCKYCTGGLTCKHRCEERAGGCVKCGRFTSEYLIKNDIFEKPCTCEDEIK